MSNDYDNALRIYRRIYPQTDRRLPWGHFITFSDDEIAGVSTAARIWTSNLPDGATTASGSRTNSVTGPTVSFSSVNAPVGMSGDAIRDAARALAVRRLVDEVLIPALPAGLSWPGSFY